MFLKRSIIIMISLLIQGILYAQSPIYKIEAGKNKRIDYQLDSKSSSLRLNGNVDLTQKISVDKNFSEFFKQKSNETDTYISSLIIIKIKEGKLYFNEKTGNTFQPDLLLNQFIKTGFLLENFEYVNPQETYTLGIYFYYDVRVSKLHVELAELKKNKFHLIYSGDKNISL